MHAESIPPREPDTIIEDSNMHKSSFDVLGMYCRSIQIRLNGMNKESVVLQPVLPNPNPELY